MRMSEVLEKVKVETVIYEDKIRKQIKLRDRSKNDILSTEKKITEDVDDLQQYESTMSCLKKFRKQSKNVMMITNQV